MDDNTFKLFLQQALNDSVVVAKFQDIFKSFFSNIADTIAAKTIEALKTENQKKDVIIATQQREIHDLQDKIDDMDQWTRRGSMRIQGLREDGAGTLQDKLLKLFNNDLKIQPPIMLEEVEVTHRLPRRRPAAAVHEPASKSAGDREADGDASSRQSPQPPQTVILKFLSRRTKSRVMVKDVRKKLKDLDPTSYPYPVYFQDDLTARRAKLAYEARQLRQLGAISDTWIAHSKVIIKDNYNRIHSVTSPRELTKLKPT